MNGCKRQDSAETRVLSYPTQGPRGMRKFATGMAGLLVLIGSAIPRTGLAATAPTLSLTAASTTVVNGQGTVLSWRSTDATRCTASGSWSGAKDLSGEESVQPAADAKSSYKLSCSGAGGKVSQTVSVTAKPPKPSVSLSAAPATIAFAGSSTLSWSSSGAASCTASGQWSGSRPLSGQESVTPAGSGSLKYTLSCTNAGGSTAQTVTLKVKPPLPTVSLAASPGTVAAGGSSTLSWSSRDATTCTASGGWSGSRAPSGNETQTLDGSTSYTLSCKNSTGTASTTLTIVVAQVLPPPPPALSTGYRGLWIDAGIAPGVSDNTAALRELLNRKLTSDDRQRFRAGLDFARQQVANTDRGLAVDRFPLRTDPASGAWLLSDVSQWTAAFWPGLLWESFRVSGDAGLADRALQKADLIDARKTDTYTHDQGFLFGLSQVKALEFVSDSSQRARYRAGALTAADTYLRKVNPLNGFVSWHGSYEDNRNKSSDSSVIDSMMNIPLLWWASEQTGDARYRDAGLGQADNMRRYAVRPDGSSAHGVEFDPRSGAVIGQHTYQGYADGSTWTRGQAWGVYGFSVVYAKTGDRSWLQTARAMADFYLAHPRLPADIVPYWDFDDPAIPQTWRDSSAAAAMAIGLQHLARFEDDPVRAEAYLQAALTSLRSLSAAPWLALGSGNAATLLQGCQYAPKGIVDNGLVFGDYFYVDAVLRTLYW